MRKKFLFSIILSISVIFNITSSILAEPAIDKTQNMVTLSSANFPQIQAQAGVLMDLKTGRVLFSKNADEKLYPASTTKILTAILALEKGNLSDVVTASKEAIGPITSQDSNMGILVGEQLTLEQLVNSMLIYSANDSANCVAVHIGGSIDQFAKMMNDKAKELGAVNSNFVNPHGFHNDNHYTTANDLSAIARYAMSNEKFRKIVSTQRYVIPPTNKYKTERILPSTNHLISKYRNSNFFYPPAIGIKTGFTSQACNCLVSAASKDGTEFLTVLLKSPNASTTKEGAYSFIDTKALFEYAFANYKYQTLSATTDIVADSNVYESKGGTRVTLSVQNDVAALLPIGIDKSKDIQVQTTLNDNITAPIKKNDILGKISYTYNGEQIGQSDLVAINDVQRDNILFVIHSITKFLVSPFFIIPIILLIAFIINLRIRAKKRRNKRRNKLSYPKGR